MRLLLGIALAVLATYFLVDVITRWKKETTLTGWDRLLAAGRTSLTMLWGKVWMVLAGLVGNIYDVLDAIGLPGIKPYLEQVLGEPKAVGVAMVLVAGVMMIARSRTL